MIDLAALRSCALCPKLVASRTQVVPAKGPSDARVMIVAQAPGRNEDRAGVPLIGKSGQQLDNLLRLHAGIDPAAVYMTNVVKCYPEADRRPSAKEAKACGDLWLAQELRDVAPTIVVTLGDVALQALAPGQKLSQCHGVALANEAGYTIFPTYHPSATNYNANLKPVLIEDFKRLRDLLAGRKRSRDGWRLGTLAEVLGGGGPIAIDYETDQPAIDGRFAPFLARPIGIALARRDKHNRIVATYEPPTVLPMLAGMLADAQVPKVAHNTKFETHVSRNVGVTLRGCHDTKIAAYLLGYLSTHLKDLSGTVLGVRQTRFNEWDGIDPMYPCGDAAYTLMLFEEFERRLREEQLWDVYEQIELPLVPVLAHMEAAGIEFDEPRRVALANEIDERIAVIEASYPDINLNSPQQVIALLTETLNAKLTKRSRKSRQFSTAKDVLEEIPEARFLVEYRELTKLRGSYVAKFPRLRASDGRIHGSFNQAGGHDDDDKAKESPSNFRLSSSNPNLQNVPTRTALGTRVYECIVPATGYVHVQADAGQEEPRIATIITGDVTLRSRLEAGVDIYLPLAQHVYNVTLKKSLATYARTGHYLELGGLILSAPHALTKADHEWRQIGKKCFLATLYGAQWRKLQSTIAKDLGVLLTAQEAQALSALLKAEYPDIASLLQLAWDEIIEHGYASTLFGHKRWLYGAFSDRPADREAAKREGGNFKVSGPGAAVMKVALRRVFDAIGDHDARIVLSVHDSIRVECRPHDVAYFTQVLIDAFQNVLPIALPVDVEIITREGYHMAPSEYAFLSRGCPHCASDLVWDNLQHWFRCVGCSRKWRIVRGEVKQVMGE